MVDLAVDGLDETVFMEFYRGQISRAFGIPKEQLDEVRTFFQSLECEVDWRNINCNALCTPSRNPITGE
jgi:hypothetical protein